MESPAHITCYLIGRQPAYKTLEWPLEGAAEAPAWRKPSNRMACHPSVYLLDQRPLCGVVSLIRIRGWQHYTQ